MDYTNFVKTYHRIALSKLNQFSNYKGTFANINYELNVPKENLHIVGNQLDCLPTYDVDINSPTIYFEKFLDYVCSNTPDLASVVLGTMGLKYFFEKYILTEIDEVKCIDIIETFIEASIEVLKNSGVII